MLSGAFATPSHDLAELYAPRSSSDALDAVYTIAYLPGHDGFEWHEDKRRQNVEERGVDFRLAARIFAGPFVEDVDDRQDYGETRYRALGRVGDDYYVVAYTWRGGNRRLISAWRVGDDGRQRYQALLAR